MRPNNQHIPVVYFIAYATKHAMQHNNMDDRYHGDNIGNITYSGQGSKTISLIGLIYTGLHI